MMVNSANASGSAGMPGPVIAAEPLMATAARPLGRRRLMGAAAAGLGVIIPTGPVRQERRSYPLVPAISAFAASPPSAE